MAIKRTVRVFFRRAMTVCVIAVLLMATVVWWAVGTTLPRLSEVPIAQPGSSISIKEAVRSMVVATYNIAHAQGLKDQPSDWRDKETTLAHLRQLAHAITQMDADVVLLQEVDIDANRTHHINQVAYLAKEANYPAYACAVLWEKNYLPFPYVPFEHQIGQVQSGNCVLSRYPLVQQERLVFDKPASNPFWYNWGYIDRGVQKIVAQVGQQLVTFFNIHLEAWEAAAKNKQVRELLRFADQVKGPLVIGGDFNAVPPEATVKAQFADEPDNNYSQDDVISYMRATAKEASEAIPEAVYRRDEKAALTFPTDIPTRRMDYLYGLKGMQIKQGRVVHEAGIASDHFPVMATVVW